MRKIILVIVAFAIIVAIAVILSRSQIAGVKQNSDGQNSISDEKNMTLTSTVFKHNENLPAAYTCDGKSINPPLQLNDIPANAKSLALVMNDPDAPSGDYVHWLIWDMDTKSEFIREDSSPLGTQGKTSTNNSGYVAPCPPSGSHHYTFTLYALDKLLGLPSSSGKEELLAAMQGHILAQAELVGIYGK